jgi:hypothetical protein
MVGLTITNDQNVGDKAVGISFRRKDQLSAESVWAVFEKVIQSNARFNALDRLTIQIHAVRMPSGSGSTKAKGRPLSVMAHLKRSIVEVKSKQTCLAHALIIAKARLDKDPDNKAYSQGRKIQPVVQTLLQTTGISLLNGGGITELEKFQEYFSDYKIVVYGGLNCEDIIFAGRVESERRLNFLYDDVNKHYHVIASLTSAMAKRYVCGGCGKGCEVAEKHRCKHACSDCMTVPPCPFSATRIPCCEYNMTFRRQTNTKPTN